MIRIYLQRFIALGQKTDHCSAQFGRGFNYHVEAGFPPGNWAEVLDSVLSRLDHKALGVDFDLGVEPSSARVCDWIARELESKSGVRVEVVLRRGDGLVVSSHP